MNFFRITTAIMGGVCVFGAAGTDERFIKMGQMPPGNLWIVFIVGLVLLLPTLVHLMRKGKK
jgi:hypothetical protein